MNNQDDTNGRPQRVHVIDTSQTNNDRYQKNKRKNDRNRKMVMRDNKGEIYIQNNAFKDETPQIEQNSIIFNVNDRWPLESMPIQRAVVEYGKRTAALGAQHGARSLNNVILMLKKLELKTPEILKIISDAEEEHAKLTLMLKEVYNDT